ncbi:MAG: hypothetical protein KJ011_03230 [Burkholderiaceae bacterium]|nr:hypothetical protein [Burkholderiaceae bacterium]
MNHRTGFAPKSIPTYLQPKAPQPAPDEARLETLDVLLSTLDDWREALDDAQGWVRAVEQQRRDVEEEIGRANRRPSGDGRPAPDWAPLPVIEASDLQALATASDRDDWYATRLRDFTLMDDDAAIQTVEAETERLRDVVVECERLAVDVRVRRDEAQAYACAVGARTQITGAQVRAMWAAKPPTTDGELIVMGAAMQHEDGEAAEQWRGIAGAIVAEAEAEHARELAGAAVTTLTNTTAPPPISTEGGEASQGWLAATLARTYAGGLAYVHRQNVWRRWTGLRWEDDRKGAVRHGIHSGARKLALAVLDAKTLNSYAFTVGVDQLMRVNPALSTDTDDWDQDLMLLGTPGGHVDLSNGCVRTARPDARISKSTAVDPAEPGTAPRRWLAFLNEATGGDAAVIGFLQKLLGYSLTGKTIEHLLVFLYGEGGNGKGVFLDTVRGIFGDYGQAADMKLFTAQRFEGHSTSLAALIGARLVTASETERGHAWAESRLKAMTGGDPIRAHFMRQDEIQFDPQFQLLLVGNHKPALGTIDDAIRRRLALVEFNRKPSVVNPRLKEELRQEWPAVLRWMIDGCLKWQAEGLERPEAVRAATEEYFEEQNTIDGWLAENCETGAKFRESSTVLFEDWTLYCRKVGAEAGTLSSFGTELGRKGFDVRRTDRGKVRAGLRLRTTGTTGSERSLTVDDLL